jgi:branched-chain amino acid transport system substrate-binding protein
MASLIRRICFTTVALSLALAVRPAVADDTIKLGYVEALSGPFASAGDEALKIFGYILDKVNAQGGALGKKFELVPFDDKLQPAEALIALKTITDQNMPFVLQCTGSNVGAALIDAVSKHNARNPDNRVLYLNCGALATELTNEKCDFWQFRFIGNVEMRAVARVKALPKSVTKVYLLNPDYLFGQSVQHDTRKWLEKLRPDIQIVGDELMPFGKVQDFSSYVAKIKASGAQSVITGNYGRDLNLLIRAAVDEGLDVRFDTYLAQVLGGATAVGSAGENRLSTVTEFDSNVPVELNKPDAAAFVAGWRATHDTEFGFLPWLTMLQMLATAINQVGSTDALKVAQALEGMKATDLVGFPVEMRAEDHQLLMPYYAVTFTKNVKYDAEKTGLGWKTDFIASTEDLTLPTTCKMKRPSS